MKKAPSTTDKVAKKIINLIDNNPPLRLMATPDAILFDLLRRFLPRRFYHWFLFSMLPNVSLWGDSWIPEVSLPDKKKSKENVKKMDSTASLNL